MNFVEMKKDQNGSAHVLNSFIDNAIPVVQGNFLGINNNLCPASSTSLIEKNPTTSPCPVNDQVMKVRPYHSFTAMNANSYACQRNTTQAQSHLRTTNFQCQVSSYSVPSYHNRNVENPVGNYIIAEFLLQLTKMLSDENRSVIEWSNGKIEVHNPLRLEATILPKYFRSSKFASFQRQLNYFGFRKVAGKGKMAPCSYVNEETTCDIRSLLGIKRKKGRSPKIGNHYSLQNDSRKRKAISLPLPTTNLPFNHYSEQSLPIISSASQLTALTNPLIVVDSAIKKEYQTAGVERGSATNCTVAKGVNRQFGYQTKNGIGEKEILDIDCDKVDESPLALARTVVGKGVKHNYVVGSSSNSDKLTISLNEQSSRTKNDAMPFLDPYLLGFEPQVFDEVSPVEPNQNYICEVQHSFKQSIKLVDNGCVENNDSSLIELAMIPSLHEGKITPDSKCEQIINKIFDAEASTIG